MSRTTRSTIDHVSPPWRAWRMRKLLIVLVTLAVGTTVACEQKKSKVEQMAEEMVSASAKAAASSSAPPDPKELEFRAKKASFETTIANYVADLGHLMANDTFATPGVLRTYFPLGAEGDKKAKDQQAFYKDLGIKGYRIDGAVKLTDTRITGAFDRAEVVFVETRAARGLSTCLVHEQNWKSEGDKWVFEAEKSVRIDPCQ